MDIELCIYFNIVTIRFLFIIQSINLPPSAHTITSSAHCSTLQPSAAYSQASSASSVHILQQSLHHQCTYYSSHYIFSAHTTAAITSSVHTATMYSHVQLPAANLQCTLQPTAAIYNHLHYNYTIQCTLQLHYLMLIPYSASSEEG